MCAKKRKCSGYGRAHPETTFTFILRYSIVPVVCKKCCRNVLRYFEAEKLQAEMLLEYDNVKLYSFLQICLILTQDLDNYKDDKSITIKKSVIRS